MALQTITNIDIDFYDKKYILINAKQYDKKSRFLSITCYNHGELYPININEHSAYIRYKKPDNNSVLNFCDIDRKGKVLVELTEQMLASDGISYVDLVIVNKGSASVDTETGEIITIDNASILSTMTFCIDVSETAVNNSEIESSYEFNGLNTALEKAEAEYKEVIQLSKSYAMGNAGGIRENEDIDNSKYYYEQSKSNAKNTESYMNAASDSATAASNSASEANTSAQNAQTYMNQANTYMENAQTSADESEASANSALKSETNASKSASDAQSSMASASSSATSALESASEAENYALQTEAIVNSLNGAFLPKATIPFSELAELRTSGVVGVGYLYNISNDFTTDDTFNTGAGVHYSAGTNVYYTVDGTWDCLTGMTVAGVKGDNETIYRKGNVNLTAKNVGAIPTTDIATVDEVTSYLGI
ncbi:MAG: hypothetical protein J6R59_09735 [Paludibacteraceae bacterium]|nr:hypothetical protein [Paludibacteraceae bacterium]